MQLAELTCRDEKDCFAFSVGEMSEAIATSTPELVRATDLVTFFRKSPTVGVAPPALREVATALAKAKTQTAGDITCFHGAVIWSLPSELTQNDFGVYWQMVHGAETSPPCERVKQTLNVTSMGK